VLGLRERRGLGSEFLGNTPPAVAAARQLQTWRFGAILVLCHALIVAPRCESVETGFGSFGEHVR
jgi:hypothetical protein